MEVDVMAKHMPGLIEFKKRVEALIDGAEAGQGSAAEAMGRQISDLRSQLSRTEDELTALRVLRESDQAGLKGLLDWFAENHAALDVLLSIGDKTDATDEAKQPADEVQEPAAETKPEETPPAAAPTAEADPVEQPAS